MEICVGWSQHLNMDFGHHTILCYFNQTLFSNNIFFLK